VFGDCRWRHPGVALVPILARAASWPATSVVSSAVSIEAEKECVSTRRYAQKPALLSDVC
jgi:hypothetical protein